MAGSGQDKEKSVGSQWMDHFVSLEKQSDCEASRTPNVQVDANYTDHTGRSHSRLGSHVSHDEETKNLRIEIYQLRKRLRHKQRDEFPPNSETNSDEDHSCR